MPIKPEDFYRDAVNEIGVMHVDDSFAYRLRSRAQLISARQDYDPEAERAKHLARVKNRVLQLTGSSPAGTVAVVPVVGTLYNKAPWWDDEALTYQAIADEVTGHANDSKVRRIMMLVDSPGGSARGQATAVNAIAAAAKMKPVEVQTDGLLASAAYALASQATKISAGRQDMVGSLGTINLFYDTSKMAADIGMKPVVVERDGALKSLGAFGVEVTQAMKDEVQRTLDGYHADFKQSIMTGRRWDEAAWQSASGGRVWIAHQTVGRLVDAVASPAETFARLLVEAGAVPNPAGSRQSAEAVVAAMREVAS